MKSAVQTARLGQDTLMREIAFDYVQREFEDRHILTWPVLKGGFLFEGRRIALVNRQQGIFKPKEMDHLLSIRTVVPLKGRKARYTDQKQQIHQIYEKKDVVDYAFMGKDPDSASNRLLRTAMECKVPVIYLLGLGISPAKYIPIRAFIVDWDPQALAAKVSLTESSASDRPITQETRRYAMRHVKQRVHQARFRDAVVSAYSHRCAMSGLPEPQLLDAAHIMPDNDPQFGQPEVVNGLPLSKIHHEAFDRHLIGIDPDYRIHVSKRLLGRSDGPTLESLKYLDGEQLMPPRRRADYPDPARLERRFNNYQAANGS